MGIVVLTRPENAKSALKLGYPAVMGKADVPSGSKVVRWGNGMETDSSGWAMVLNKYQALQLSTRKLEALASMARVVNTPKLYRCGDTLPKGKRYIGRPANHAEGSDFHMIDLREAPRSSACSDDHATEYLEDTNEYRVWFIRDKYLVARRVPRASEGQLPTDTCRSKWGYEFVRECFPKLKEEVTKARTAIPLDFGAIDVLWKDADDEHPGRWYFLEFNSAPSLDHEKVLKHFQTHLKAILGPQEAQVVPEVVQTPQSAVNRLQERPYMEPVAATTRRAPSSWEEKYRKELLATKKARELEIQREVFGE